MVSHAVVGCNSSNMEKSLDDKMQLRRVQHILSSMFDGLKMWVLAIGPDAERLFIHIG